VEIYMWWKFTCGGKCAYGGKLAHGGKFVYGGNLQMHIYQMQCGFRLVEALRYTRLEASG